MTTTDQTPTRPGWRFDSMPGWTESVSYAVRISITSEISTIDVWDEVYGKSPRLELTPTAALELAGALIEAAEMLGALQR